MYKEIILDVSTGEETFIDFSKAELEENLKKEEQIALETLKVQEIELQKQALKDSANSKLSALGLTPDEIAAITG